MTTNDTLTNAHQAYTDAMRAYVRLQRQYDTLPATERRKHWQLCNAVYEASAAYRVAKRYYDELRAGTDEALALVRAYTEKA